MAQFSRTPRIESHRFQSALENFQLRLSRILAVCKPPSRSVVLLQAERLSSCNRRKRAGASAATGSRVGARVSRLSVVQGSAPAEAIDELRRALPINPKLKNRLFSNPAWENGFQSNVVGICSRPSRKHDQIGTERRFPHYSLGFAYAQLRRFKDAVNEFQASAKLIKTS